jgi:hypothetical protein
MSQELPCPWDCGTQLPALIEDGRLVYSKNDAMKHLKACAEEALVEDAEVQQEQMAAWAQ